MWQNHRSKSSDLSNSKARRLRHVSTGGNARHTGSNFNNNCLTVRKHGRSRSYESDIRPGRRTVIGTNTVRKPDRYPHRLIEESNDSIKNNNDSPLYITPFDDTRRTLIASNFSSTYVQMMISTIVNHYNSLSTDQISSKMIARPPGQKEFFNIFEVIFQGIDPNSKHSIQTKSTESSKGVSINIKSKAKSKIPANLIILNILEHLKYPYKLNPSILQSVTSVYSWNLLLHVLYWLSNLGKIISSRDVLDFITNACEMQATVVQTPGMQLKTPVSRKNVPKTYTATPMKHLYASSKKLRLDSNPRRSINSGKIKYEIIKHLELLKAGYVTRIKRKLPIGELMDNAFQDKDFLIEKDLKEYRCTRDLLAKRLNTLDKGDKEILAFKELDSSILTLYSKFVSKKELTQYVEYSESVLKDWLKKLELTRDNKQKIEQMLVSKELEYRSYQQLKNECEPLHLRKEHLMSTCHILSDRRKSLLEEMRNNELKISRLKKAFVSSSHHIDKLMMTVKVATMTTAVFDNCSNDEGNKNCFKQKFSDPPKIELGDILQGSDLKSKEGLIAYQQEVNKARIILQSQIMHMKTKLCEHKLTLNDLKKMEEFKQNKLRKELACQKAVKDKYNEFDVLKRKEETEDMEVQIHRLQLELEQKKEYIHNRLINMKQLESNLHDKRTEYEHTFLPYVRNMEKRLNTELVECNKRIQTVEAKMNKTKKQCELFDTLTKTISERTLTEERKNKNIAEKLAILGNVIEAIKSSKSDIIPS
ncbi:hypothetical protein GJ496_009550 [Pomphorhynchus laevis]|nr:hypothetical protein GJ496_009550 [Pomphorhynchus laevis]